MKLTSCCFICWESDSQLLAFHPGSNHLIHGKCFVGLASLFQNKCPICSVAVKSRGISRLWAKYIHLVHSQQRMATDHLEKSDFPAITQMVKEGLVVHRTLVTFFQRKFPENGLDRGISYNQGHFGRVLYPYTAMELPNLMYFAIRNGLYVLVQTILDAGMRLDEHDHTPWCLHFAAISNSVETLQLIEANADPAFLILPTTVAIMALIGADRTLKYLRSFGKPFDILDSKEMEAMTLDYLHSQGVFLDVKNPEETDKWKRIQCPKVLSFLELVGCLPAQYQTQNKLSEADDEWKS